MLLTNYDRLNQSGSQQDFYDFQALLYIRKLEHNPDRPPRIAVTDETSEEAATVSELDWTKNFWIEIEDFVVANGVARDQLTGFFDRLLRTGLFRQYSVWGDNKAHPWGYTTPNLGALEAAITKYDRE